MAVTPRMRLGDECFTLGGREYWFMLSNGGGALGFSSSSPFAPKSAIGERTYNDYDATSAVALTDFAGGMGQERISDATKYYDAENVDARSGHLVLGPQVHADPPLGMRGTSDPSLATYLYLLSGEANYEFVAKVSFAATTNVQRIWLPLQALGQAPQLHVYSNAAGAPGTLLASGTFAVDELRSYPEWTPATVVGFAAEAGQSYWIGLENVGNEYPVNWAMVLAVDPISGMAARRMGSTEWEPVEMLAPVLWIEPAGDDEPLQMITGYGKDGISRVWAYNARRLFYAGADSTLKVVSNGAGLGEPKDLAGAVCAAWYQAAADAHPYLYLGQGDDLALQRFDGQIGTEGWSAISGVEARAMCQHDGLLYLADEINEVRGWDAITLAEAGTVGDKSYPIRKLVSWDSYLWACKDDGLYRLSLPDGYPTTGAPEAQKVLNFGALACSDNFAAVCVHQGDLYFAILQGLMRYTSGGVLTPVGPEAGLDTATSSRRRCKTLCSTLGTLWAGFEAPIGAWSSLMGYVDGAWHPVAKLPRSGDMVRGMVAEPGWYGDGTARVWFGCGLDLGYVLMPMGTHKRWTWEIDWAATGYFYTSWIDGGLRTVDKDWVSVEIDGELWSDSRVRVAWRPNEATAWVELGVLVDDGVTRLDFPDGSYGVKCQLRITLERAERGPWSPRVEAIVLRYMERPQDVRTYTRTYELSTNQTWRNGLPILESLEERGGWLRTLRQAKEPLVWHNWTGGQVQVHMIGYAGSEVREERGDVDKVTVIVQMQLQEV